MVTDYSIPQSARLYPFKVGQEYRSSLEEKCRDLCDTQSSCAQHPKGHVDILSAEVGTVHVGFFLFLKSQPDMPCHNQEYAGNEEYKLVAELVSILS